MLYTRRWIKAATAALVLCVVLSLGGFYGQCAGIRESVVRLHILANSDSTEDQTLKLLVRDAVTKAADGWLDGAENAMEALTLARDRLPDLQAVAQQTVHQAGYAYPVKATLCRMYFTTRQYDTVTLPAGMYEAVRIEIGAAAGQNWWCVVFPPMCVGAATDSPTLSDVLSEEQQELVDNGERYRARFAILEWLEALFNLFR